MYTRVAASAKRVRPKSTTVSFAMVVTPRLRNSWLTRLPADDRDVGGKGRGRDRDGIRNKPGKKKKKKNEVSRSGIKIK